MRIYSRKVTRYHKSTHLRLKLIQRYTQPRYLYLTALLLRKLQPVLSPLLSMIEPPHRYLYDHLSSFSERFYIPFCCQYEIIVGHFAYAKNRVIAEQLLEPPKHC